MSLSRCGGRSKRVWNVYCLTKIEKIKLLNRRTLGGQAKASLWFCWASEPGEVIVKRKQVVKKSHEVFKGWDFFFFFTLYDLNIII